MIVILYVISCQRSPGFGAKHLFYFTLPLLVPTYLSSKTVFLIPPSQKEKRVKAQLPYIPTTCDGHASDLLLFFFPFSFGACLLSQKRKRVSDLSLFHFISTCGLHAAFVLLLLLFACYNNTRVRGWETVLEIVKGEMEKGEGEGSVGSGGWLIREQLSPSLCAYIYLGRITLLISSFTIHNSFFYYVNSM